MNGIFDLYSKKSPHGTLKTRVKLLKIAEQTKRPNSVSLNKVDSGVHYQLNYSR